MRQCRNDVLENFWAETSLRFPFRHALYNLHVAKHESIESLGKDIEEEEFESKDLIRSYAALFK